MVGDLLRQKREEKGLTIKDVEKETNIRSLYIKAIEEGKDEVLPGAAYVKGFIKNYANFLGMDEAALVAQYKSEHGVTEQAVEAETKQEAVKLADQSEVSSVKSPLKEKMAEKKKMPVVAGSGGMGKKIIAGIGAIVIIGGLYMAFSSDEQPAAAPQAKQTQQSAEKKAEPVADKKKPAEAVEISVKFTDRCWTEVSVDNKVVYEGTAKKGDTLSWKGKESVKITAGNAGAIDVSCNGDDTGKLGGTGEVVTKTYNKDGVQADKKDVKDTKQDKKANQKK